MRERENGAVLAAKGGSREKKRELRFTSCEQEAE